MRSPVPENSADRNFVDTMLTMNGSTRSQRFNAVIAGVSALALLLSVAIPHHHESSSVSHPASTCRACRIQESFAATTPVPALCAAQPVVVVVDSLRPSDAPHVDLILRVASPRAPPVLS